MRRNKINIICCIKFVWGLEQVVNSCCEDKKISHYKVYLIDLSEMIKF